MQNSQFQLHDKPDYSLHENVDIFLIYHHSVLLPESSSINLLSSVRDFAKNMFSANLFGPIDTPGIVRSMIEGGQDDVTTFWDQMLSPSAMDCDMQYVRFEDSVFRPLYLVFHHQDISANQDSSPSSCIAYMVYRPSALNSSYIYTLKFDLKTLPPKFQEQMLKKMRTEYHSMSEKIRTEYHSTIVNMGWKKP